MDKRVGTTVPPRGWLGPNVNWGAVRDHTRRRWQRTSVDYRNMQGGEMQEKRLANIYGATGGNYAGWIYIPNGLSPTINTGGGGYRQPLIMEVTKIAINGKNARERFI